MRAWQPRKKTVIAPAPSNLFHPPRPRPLPLPHPYTSAGPVVHLLEVPPSPAIPPSPSQGPILSCLTTQWPPHQSAGLPQLEPLHTFSPHCNCNVHFLKSTSLHRLKRSASPQDPVPSTSSSPLPFLHGAPAHWPPRSLCTRSSLCWELFSSLLPSNRKRKGPSSWKPFQRGLEATLVPDFPRGAGPSFEMICFFNP